MQTIKSSLRNFKLSGIYNSVEERLTLAQNKSLSYIDFLTLLLEDEENNRRDNSYKKRFSKAKFPYIKKLKILTLAFNPQLINA